MPIPRFDPAQEFHVPNHVDMRRLRLQGHAASDTRQLVNVRDRPAALLPVMANQRPQ